MAKKEDDCVTPTVKESAPVDAGVEPTGEIAEEFDLVPVEFDEKDETPDDLMSIETKTVLERMNSLLQVSRYTEYSEIVKMILLNFANPQEINSVFVGNDNFRKAKFITKLLKNPKVLEWLEHLPNVCIKCLAFVAKMSYVYLI